MEPNFEKYYYKDFDFVPVSFCWNFFWFIAEIIIPSTLTAILDDCDRFNGKSIDNCLGFSCTLYMDHTFVFGSSALDLGGMYCDSRGSKSLV